MSSFRYGTATARGQASLGGSSTRVGRPGRKEPGTPEGVPRTTAITRHRGHKKSACDEEWALLRLSIPTGQGRIADASATEAIYPYGPACARARILYFGHTFCRKNVGLGVFKAGLMNQLAIIITSQFLQARMLDGLNPMDLLVQTSLLRDEQ